jgi:membrane protease YdiL (CAAX protease family)
MSEYRALDSASVFLVYGAILLLSLMGDWMYGGSFVASWTSAQPLPTGAVLAALIFVVVAIVAATLLTSLFAWGAEIERVFQQILTPLSYFQILVLSLVSGFLEEWFFRGILLSYFGLIISSVVFGLAHFLPARKIWRWSLWAFAAGLVLGWMQMKFQNLWLTAMTHSAVNFFLLMKINLKAHRFVTRARMRR